MKYLLAFLTASFALAQSPPLQTVSLSDLVNTGPAKINFNDFYLYNTKPARFFGSGAPGIVALSIQGDFYFNTAASPVAVYFCASVSCSTGSPTWNPVGIATSGSSLLYGNGAGGFSNATIGQGISFSGGAISCVTGAFGTLGCLRPDNTTIVAVSGTLSASLPPNCSSGAPGLVPATGGVATTFLNGACGFTTPPGMPQVYPGAGVANSTGSAWGASYTVGIAANNLVQLNGSAKLPAVDGSLLTNLPSGGGGSFVATPTNVSANALQAGTVTGWTTPATLTVFTVSLTNNNSSATVTITVSGNTYTILRNGGAGPLVNQIQPNGETLILNVAGSTAWIANDPYTCDTTMTCPFGTYPWTIGLNSAALLPLSYTWTGYHNFNGGFIRFPESVVGSLPSATANAGKEFIVTDGISASDCGTGGGTTVVNICRSNGTSWVFIGGGGGVTLTNCSGNLLPAMSSNTAGNCLPAGGLGVTWDGDHLNVPNVSTWSAVASSCSGSYLVNEAAGTDHFITLTGNCTLTSNGGFVNEQLVVQVCQDGTGGRSLIWPATYNNPPPMPQGANKCVAPIFWTADGTNFWNVSVALVSSTNCSSSASPAVCGSAAAGSIAFPTGVTSVALTVNTSAVTASSQILLFSDDSLGTKLGVTCNSTLATLVGGMAVTARTSGTSFTVTYNGTIATNPLCASYAIIN